VTARCSRCGATGRASDHGRQPLANANQVRPRRRTRSGACQPRDGDHVRYVVSLTTVPGFPPPDLPPHSFEPTAVRRDHAKGRPRPGVYIPMVSLLPGAKMWAESRAVAPVATFVVVPASAGGERPLACVGQQASSNSRIGRPAFAMARTAEPSASESAAMRHVSSSSRQSPSRGPTSTSRPRWNPRWLIASRKRAAVPAAPWPWPIALGEIITVSTAAPRHRPPSARARPPPARLTASRADRAATYARAI